MLTQQDFKQIKNLIDSSFESYDKKISERFQLLGNQILEYTDAVKDAHEDWLNDHERRIKQLENNSSIY